MLFEFQDNEVAREKWKDLRISQIEFAGNNYKGKYHALCLILIVLGERMIEVWGNFILFFIQY